MQTKEPTLVLAVRVPVTLAEAIRETAKGRKLSVNKMLSLDLLAKYYCGQDEQKSFKKEQPSDADTIDMEMDE